MLPPLNKISDRLLRPDPLLPGELLPRWRRALNAALRMLSRYFALSFAAWAGSIPLAAKYFHLFSPVSTPANIVAVPLGTLALMSNLGALVCGAWFPWATELFNHSAWFFMSAMTRVSEWFARIPGAFFYVPAPSWLAIVIYYAVLVGGLSGWLFAPQRRIWSAADFGSDCRRLRLALAERHAREIKLTVLPLNGGHAVFVDAAGRKNDWLVDCGNENAVDFTLKPFLRAQGVNKIPRLVLTQGDLRNIGGAESLTKISGSAKLSPARFISVPAPIAKSSRNLKNRRRGIKSSIAATPPVAGGFCIPTPRKILRARTMRRWCCSEIFPARAFCCCPIWAATGKAHCSRTQTICARTLSSPVCRTKANRCATRCSMRFNRKSSSLPTRNFRRPAARAGIKTAVVRAKCAGDLHANCGRGENCGATEGLGIADDGRTKTQLSVAANVSSLIFSPGKIRADSRRLLQFARYND